MCPESMLVWSSLCRDFFSHHARGTSGYHSISQHDQPAHFHTLHTHPHFLSFFFKGGKRPFCSQLCFHLNPYMSRCRLSYFFREVWDWCVVMWMLIVWRNRLVAFTRQLPLSLVEGGSSRCHAHGKDSFMCGRSPNLHVHSSFFGFFLLLFLDENLQFPPPLP